MVTVSLIWLLTFWVCNRGQKQDRSFTWKIGWFARMSLRCKPHWGSFPGTCACLAMDWTTFPKSQSLKCHFLAPWHILFWVHGTKIVWCPVCHLLSMLAISLFRVFFWQQWGKWCPTVLQTVTWCPLPPFLQKSMRKTWSVAWDAVPNFFESQESLNRLLWIREQFKGNYVNEKVLMLLPVRLFAHMASQALWNRDQKVADMVMLQVVMSRFWTYGLPHPPVWIILFF